jgi:hypothetical protein
MEHFADDVAAGDLRHRWIGRQVTGAILDRVYDALSDELATVTAAIELAV